jgi:hypothetical protein
MGTSQGNQLVSAAAVAGSFQPGLGVPGNWPAKNFARAPPRIVY